jgi:GT2 family glycosyltransferase
MVLKVRETTYPYVEIIVVDNGSSDGTIEMLHKDFPEVEAIALNENIGIEARNIGFKKAKGKYIVGLDDDSYPAPDALQKMVTFFEGNPDVALIAFKIIVPSNNYVVTQHWPEEPSRFWGCGFGIRAEVLARAGFYSGDFFIYANEDDLVIRVKELGGLIRYLPDAIAYHAKMPSPGSRNGIYFGTRNRLWFMRKYMTGYYKYLGFFRVVTLFGLQALRYHFCRAFLEGLKEGLGHPVSGLQNRVVISKTTQRWYVESNLIFKPLWHRMLRKVVD